MGVWQSRVEIEGYSVAYFDRLAAFEAMNFLQGRGSYALRRFIRYSCIYGARMSPALNESSATWHFEHSNAIEIRAME